MEITLTIGKTTYLVTCHFSETSKETLQDKLKRMILKNIQSGNLLNFMFTLFCLDGTDDKV